ncbi:MAG: ATP-binding cassette domain-containing protein [Candidatus Omnitrophica bacterium]|nr:ATP-binding cassette domain-containing protein [Candidatus Omnitrophota bacterium]MBU4473464.1 ATP-binding cassette domain-containing protein [Candidatus Omnitrophota bacterium]MCG2706201.1 ATP-binding cassette domain-containing protein [Candidatus Omnitrophota bacterium]
MINISNLSKSYGRKALFENVSLSINHGEKIGLLGPNGTGKTTLFSMILGQTEPSSGAISINKNIRFGYLPQEASFSSEQTVLSELIEGDEEINRLNQEKGELENNNLADSRRYGEILERLEALGYFELEHKAKKILMGLEFKESDFSRPIKQLSGGWQMRTLLAKLLTCYYDILLLDEPTNYLDLNAALWFKDYLAGFKGTFIIISHDKAFLNEVTNYTLILEHGSIYKTRGNYEHYQTIKDEKRRFLTKQFQEQEKKRLQLERFIARFHGQPNKASQVRAKRTALERMEEIVVPPDPRESIKEFHFPPSRRSGHNVIALEKISKSYGDIQVYKELDFEVTRQEKAVLAGKNGAGKSTLLKIMAGAIGIDSGARILGHNVEIGYFSQARLDVLNPENTVLKEAYSAAPGFMSQSAIRTILGAFLFTGDDADKKVSVLSGGEKSRLILAKLLIDPPNFLLLDEPTTHLDVDAVDALLNALSQYQGTIVFISHDIHFVRSLANVVFQVEAGIVRKISGNFDYYLQKKAKGEIPTQELPARAGTQESFQKIEREKLRQQKKETQRQEQEQRRKAQEKEQKEQHKAHNRAIREKTRECKKERETLRLEGYAKRRVLSGPRRHHRDEETIKAYEQRIREIDTLISQIDNRIKTLESTLQF